MRPLPLLILAALVVALPSCVSTVTTAPDGTVKRETRVDTEALNPWAETAREVVAQQYARAPQVRAEK